MSLASTVGGWVRSRFLDAAAPPPGEFNPSPRNFDKDVTPLDFKTVVAASRRLYANCGIVKAIDDKAMYAVGRAWLPRFAGKDRKWGDEATAWLVDKWYPVSNIRGANYDFQTSLYLESISIDRDGDVGVLLTETADGWPLLQHIPGHRIATVNTPDGLPLVDGPYKGLVIRQGVIYNAYGRPVAYRIQNDAGYSDVSARDFIHMGDPSWFDQGRFLPAFTHAINDLLALKKTQGYEQMALQLLSAIGIIEENETGIADPKSVLNNLKSLSSSSSPNKEISTKEAFGGLYKIFRAATGSKLSTLEHGRPGPNWESFWNRVIKASCAGTSWPYELLWALNTLGGANLRAVLAKANRAVEDRQDLLRPHARRKVQYAVAKAIKLGELRASDEWWRWSFTVPARITVDVGREAAQDRADYADKLTTLEDLLQPQGLTTEDHYRQLAKEHLEREAIAKEMGVPVEVLAKTQSPQNPAQA